MRGGLLLPRGRAAMARMRARARGRRGGWGMRILNGIAGLIVGFVVLSLFWVLLYKWVNPPYTLTMLGDRLQGRNVTRKWMPVGAIDRDMVRAAIAAEDSKF